MSWIRSDTIRKTVCLSTHPNWMGEKKNALGHLKMREIYIPGTHDSAAYAKLQYFQHEIIVDKYTITQVNKLTKKKNLIILKFNLNFVY